MLSIFFKYLIIKKGIRIVIINEEINIKHSSITNTLNAFDNSGSFYKPIFKDKNKITKKAISAMDIDILPNDKPDFFFVT